jgi:hypothetical protein
MPTVLEAGSWYDSEGCAMPQLVFEFWSQEVDPIVEAIRRVLGSCPTKNVAAGHSLQCEPTQQGLDWAAHQFSRGELTSFRLHPQNSGIRYALLIGPDFGGDKRPGYMGTIEYTRADYHHIWSGLLEVDGLRLVCLGYEEGVEFTGEQLTAETFPWDDQFLVIGAVRSRVGDWIQKHGPNYVASVDGPKGRSEV